MLPALAFNLNWARKQNTASLGEQSSLTSPPLCIQMNFHAILMADCIMMTNLCPSSSKLWSPICVSSFLPHFGIFFVTFPLCFKDLYSKPKLRWESSSSLAFLASQTSSRESFPIFEAVRRSKPFGVRNNTDSDDLRILQFLGHFSSQQLEDCNVDQLDSLNMDSRSDQNCSINQFSSVIIFYLSSSLSSVLLSVEVSPED